LKPLFAVFFVVFAVCCYLLPLFPRRTNSRHFKGEMMNKKKKIIAIALLVWFAIFAVDTARAHFWRLRPIFAAPSYGGEYTGYHGLGYTIEFFYPIMGPDDTGPGVHVAINPYPYIFVNVVILVALLR
jgi:hypothetical protein